MGEFGGPDQDIQVREAKPITPLKTHIVTGDGVGINMNHVGANAEVAVHGVGGLVDAASDQLNKAVGSVGSGVDQASDALSEKISKFLGVGNKPTK